jgi:hypothetical protein
MICAHVPAVGVPEVRTCACDLIKPYDLWMDDLSNKLISQAAIGCVVWWCSSSAAVRFFCDWPRPRVRTKSEEEEEAPSRRPRINTASGLAIMGRSSVRTTCTIVPTAHRADGAGNGHCGVISTAHAARSRVTSADEKTVRIRPADTGEHVSAAAPFITAVCSAHIMWLGVIPSLRFRRCTAVQLPAVAHTHTHTPCLLAVYLHAFILIDVYLLASLGSLVGANE